MQGIMKDVVPEIVEQANTNLLPPDLVPLLIARFVADHLPQLEDWLEHVGLDALSESLASGKPGAIALWLYTQNVRHVQLQSLLREGVLPSPLRPMSVFDFAPSLAEKLNLSRATQE